MAYRSSAEELRGERAKEKAAAERRKRSWSSPRLEVAKPPATAAVPAAAAAAAAARQFGRVIARSPAMLEMLDIIERFVRTDVSITLVGETGAGKDVLAHAIHAHSTRSGGPLVVFDCGAVAANLAESELLGHERGAFTGAVRGHAGAFERAYGGTLFLDEIGELQLDLQSRLLRALESRKVRRVGGRTEHRVDTRVIAATNRDLRADVSAGRFREDLFFRLAVAVVLVPPLRKRHEDMPDLVHGLLRDLGRPDLRVSEAAFSLLANHSWPGNVRELKNALACAVAFVDREATVLEEHHLRLLSVSHDEAKWVDDLPLAGQRLERIEGAAIRQTLALVKGNKMEAARILGIAASTLYEKLKKYGMQ